VRLLSESGIWNPAENLRIDLKSTLSLLSTLWMFHRQYLEKETDLKQMLGNDDDTSAFHRWFPSQESNLPFAGLPSYICQLGSLLRDFVDWPLNDSSNRHRNLYILIIWTMQVLIGDLREDVLFTWWTCTYCWAVLVICWTEWEL